MSAAEPRGGEDWPQFLGPRRDGISRETGLNLDWKARPPKILWKVPLGNSFSALAIAGGRAYTTAKRGNRDFIVCLDAKTGKRFGPMTPPQLPRQAAPGGRARGTPTVHQGRVYCLLAMGELICLTADKGQRVWETDTFRTTGAVNPAGAFYYWGVSLSPLVEGDLVIVQPGGTNNNSVAAYHKDTGKLAWMAAATRRLRLADHHHRRGPPAGGLSDGSVGPRPRPSQGRRAVALPLRQPVQRDGRHAGVADGLLFVSAAYGAGCAALEITADGDRWAVRESGQTRSFFKTSLPPAWPWTAISMAATATCARSFCAAWTLKTGAMKWEARSPCRTALLAVDGHLLNWDENGNLSLLEATPRAYVVKGELPNLLTHKSWRRRRWRTAGCTCATSGTRCAWICGGNEGCRWRFQRNASTCRTDFRIRPSDRTDAEIRPTGRTALAEARSMSQMVRLMRHSRACSRSRSRPLGTQVIS